MRHFEPCMCGDPECPRCGLYYRHKPHYAIGSLDAEDIDILHEQAAADEEAELRYRRMLEEDEAYQAEQAAHAEEAERWYAAHEDDATPPVEHDLF